MPFSLIQSGSCVLMRLSQVPIGTDIISAAAVSKRQLLIAGIDGCYTSVRVSTATPSAFTKATIDVTMKIHN